MTQIKERKNGRRKRETFFTSVVTIAREMPKTKGKNPDKMCQLISLKMYSQ